MQLNLKNIIIMEKIFKAINKLSSHFEEAVNIISFSNIGWFAVGDDILTYRGRKLNFNSNSLDEVLDFILREEFLCGERLEFAGATYIVCIHVDAAYCINPATGRFWRSNPMIPEWNKKGFFFVSEEVLKKHIGDYNFTRI